MPDKKIDAEFIQNTLERLKEQKLPFETAAEIVRQVESGLADRDVYEGDNGIEFNFYQIDVEQTSGTLAQSEPRPTVVAKNTKDVNGVRKAAEIQALTSSKLANQHLQPKLLNSQRDNQICGLGFWHWDWEAGKLDRVNYFDCYFDNIKGCPTEQSFGRYGGHRVLEDIDVFKDAFKDELQKLGLKLDSINTADISLPGREPAGIYLSDRYQTAEKSTLKRPRDFLKGGRAQPTTDNIVEYYIFYSEDEESESGLSRFTYAWIEGQGYILRKVEVPFWLGRMPYYAFSWTSVSGQFWQPSTFLYQDKMQAGINWFWRKMLGNVDQLDFAPMLVPLSSGLVDANGKPLPGRQITGAKGQMIAYTAGAQNKPERLEVDTFPNQYFTAVGELVEMQKLQSGTQDARLAIGQENQSGRAIEETKDISDIRFVPMQVNQREVLTQVGEDVALTCQYDMFKQQIMAVLTPIFVNYEAEDIEEYADRIISGSSEEIDEDIYAAIPELAEDPLYFRNELQAIKDNYNYDFLITPHIPRQQKILMMLQAAENPMVQAMSTIPGPVDPVTGKQAMSVDAEKALTIAANMTDNTLLADQIIAVANEYDVMKEQEMAEQAKQDAAETAKALEPSGPPQAAVPAVDPVVMEAMEAAQGEEVSLEDQKRAGNKEADKLKKS